MKLGNCIHSLIGKIILSEQVTDFSVVLFRSDFILFSEENRMKVHENQWVLTMPCLLEHLAGATSRGQTMTPEGQKPSQWLCLAKFPRERYSQPIVYKALSWSAIRKSACILAEITIRKSQRQFIGNMQGAHNIPLPGLALPGFPSGSESTPIPYKTEKSVLPEPGFHPTTLGYTHWL